MPFGGRVCGHVHGPAAPGVVLVSAEASGCSKVRCCSARPTLASAIRRPPARASATFVRTCRFGFAPARCACWRATGLTHLMEGAAGRSGGDRFQHPACRARPSGRQSQPRGERVWALSLSEPHWKHLTTQGSPQRDRRAAVESGGSLRPGSAASTGAMRKCGRQSPTARADRIDARQAGGRFRPTVSTLPGKEAAASRPLLTAGMGRHRGRIPSLRPSGSFAGYFFGAPSSVPFSL